MNIRLMFPSKYLKAHDLEPGFTPVTIVKVDYQEVRNNSGPGRSADPEVLYTIYFEQFKKPMKLKKQNAEAIATALGTENVDEWKGRRVRIYPTEVRIDGKQYPCIFVDWTPPPGNAPVLNSGSTSSASDLAKLNTKPLGTKGKDRLVLALAEQGATFDELLAWMKRERQAVYERVVGLAMEDIPGLALDSIAYFLKHYHQIKTSKPQEPAGSAIAELSEDDIPF